MIENVEKIKIMWDLLDGAYDSDSSKFSVELIEKVVELPYSIKITSDEDLKRKKLIALQTELAKPIDIYTRSNYENVDLFQNVTLQFHDKMKSIKVTYQLVNLSDLDLYQIQSIQRIIADSGHYDKKIDVNTVIDENKSVKWNREKIIKINKNNSELESCRRHIYRIFNDFLTRFEKERAIYCSSMDIPYDSEFMQKIWDEAYDSSHSCGINEVEDEATRLLNLFNELFPIYNKELLKK